MIEHTTIEGTYGPGTYTDTSFIPVPEDAKRLLLHLASITPGFTKDSEVLDAVDFIGDDLPIIPGPIKAQVMSAVLQAMIGITAKEILSSKGVEAGQISINTDQAGLYPATPALVTINGKTLAHMSRDHCFPKQCKDLEQGCMHSNAMRYCGWAIYPTREENVWYQVIANMTPYKFFNAYGLDADEPVQTKGEAYNLIKATMSTYSARELEQINMEHGLCGQTCFSPKKWRETLMGQALARHTLVDYKRDPGSEDLPPISFPVMKDDQRPLAGIKVVELVRVIAGSALGASLASLGAEVVKIQNPNLPDPNIFQMSLTAGKFTCSLDLNLEPDRQKLHDLMQDADVVIQAFRLRSLERKGFGQADMMEMARKRGKGIVYLDLNCYGPEGTYAERPGYQQIADAASGCSYIIGKAYGFVEGTGVLPSLPISDMLAGAAGVLDVLLALRDRARHGGSYYAISALVSADTAQLTQEFGLYQPRIVSEIQERFQFDKMTPDVHMEDLLWFTYDAWSSRSNLLNQSEFFVTFPNGPFGKNHSILAPVVRFENKAASPRWNHSPVPFCQHEKVGWGLGM